MDLTAIFGGLRAFVPATTPVATWLLGRGVDKKRAEVIEVAAKRIDFWDKLVTAQLKVLEPGLAQDQFRESASQAIERIRQETDQALLYLSWKLEIRRSLQKKTHELMRGNHRKADVIFYTIAIWVCGTLYFAFLALGLYDVHTFGFRNLPGTKTPAVLLIGALMLGLLYGSASARIAREEAKYVKPDPPLFSKI